MLTERPSPVHMGKYWCFRLGVKISDSIDVTGIRRRIWQVVYLWRGHSCLSRRESSRRLCIGAKNPCSDDHSCQNFSRSGFRVDEPVFGSSWWHAPRTTRGRPQTRAKVSLIHRQRQRGNFFARRILYR